MRTVFLYAKSLLFLVMPLIKVLPWGLCSLKAFASRKSVDVAVTCMCVSVYVCYYSYYLCMSSVDGEIHHRASCFSLQLQPLPAVFLCHQLPLNKSFICEKQLKRNLCGFRWHCTWGWGHGREWEDPNRRFIVWGTELSGPSLEQWRGMIQTRLKAIHLLLKRVIKAENGS